MGLETEKALVTLILRACNNLEGGVLPELKLAPEAKEQIKLMLKSIKSNAENIIKYYHDPPYVQNCNLAIITNCKNIRGFVVDLDRKQKVAVHQLLKSIRDNLKNLVASIQVELAA